MIFFLLRVDMIDVIFVQKPSLDICDVKVGDGYKAIEIV